MLPLIGMVVAAVVRAQGGHGVGSATSDWWRPFSVTRGIIAYLGVAAWAWGVVSGPRLLEATRRLWYAPLLYVALGLALLSVMAVTHEEGVRALRSGVKLGLGTATWR